MTITSCEEETLKDYNEPNQVLKTIDFTIADAVHLYENDKNLKQTIEKIKNNMQKATSSSIYNFGIYESSIQVLEATNYTQYTFEVYRDTSISGQLENYVLKIYNDDSNEQFIVTYDLNPDYSYSFNNIEAINDPSLITTKSFGCYIEFVDSFDITECSPIYCSIDGHEDGGNGCQNSPANGGQPNPDLGLNCETTTVFVFAESDGCNGGATDSTPNPAEPQEPTTNTGPGSTTNDPNDSSEPEEETTITNPYTKVSQCTRDAINNLPQDQADWINSLDDCVFGGTTCNQQLYDDITGFVDDNNEDCVINSEAEDFLNAVKDAIEDDPDVEVDWEDRVFEQLKHEKLKCIHKKNKNTGENNFYNTLLSTFHDNTGNWLFIRNDSLPNNLATTKGSFLNSSINTGIPDTYEITISNSIADNGSNLAITVIILHELIHAMMFDVLSDDGIITFHPTTGEPSFATVLFDEWCDPTENYNDVELNSLSRKDRFKSLICALHLSNNISNTFTHEIFENDFFAPISFHEKISEFLIDNHDWPSEPQAVISYYQSVFGSNWKTKLVEIVSWKGLEETPEFLTWLNNNNMTVANFNLYLDSATYQLNNNCND